MEKYTHKYFPSRATFASVCVYFKSDTGKRKND